MSITLARRDYLWSYVGIILSMFGYIIMLPAIMYFLDGNHLGLWYVFQSLAAITTLFDFGFSTTFARNINYSWSGIAKLEKTGTSQIASGEPNYVLMKTAMRACRLVFLVISIAAFAIMMTIGMVYVDYIARDIGGWESLICWVIYALAIFMNLYFGYFGSFLRGVGAIADANKATVFARVTQIVLTIALLVFGCGLLGVSVAYLAYGMVYRLLARRYFYRFKGIGDGLKSVKEDPARGEVRDAFVAVWHNAWREGLVSLSNYLSSQACTILISLYATLTETAAYSMGVQLAVGVSTVSAAMYTANQSVLQSCFISGDKKRMKRTMSLVVVSMCVVNVLGTIVVVVVALPLLRIIRPDVVLGTPIMLAISAYEFIIYFRNCYTSYFSCTNRILYVRAFVVSSILCVVLGWFALSVLSLGAWGLIASQMFSQLVYNAWVWPLKAHREMGLSIGETARTGWAGFWSVVKGFFERSGRRG